MTNDNTDFKLVPVTSSISFWIHQRLISIYISCIFKQMTNQTRHYKSHYQPIKPVCSVFKDQTKNDARFEASYNN